MALKLGATTLTALYLGSTAIATAYLGATEVYTTGGGAYIPTDADAAAYISAVETVDGEVLEDGVREAIDNFVIGCKADGIWTAIKASCILAGARTLSGALVPLVGPTPTDYNFIPGDYDRKTGLRGDDSTTYLDTNYADDSVAQDNLHFAAFLSEASATEGVHMGTSIVGSGLSEFGDANAYSGFVRSRAVSPGYIGPSPTLFRSGFWGASRDNAANFDWYTGTVNGNVSSTSVAATGTNFSVFRRGNAASYSSARISFYSIGESLSLSLLKDRIVTLMADIDGAIA